MITVKNLVKKYKKSDTAAVDNISFNVEKGEFFAFLGPNGAGKTTTISILTTTLAKTSGEVSVAGINVDESPEDIRKKIGIIFQKPSLDENLTAEENVRFHASLYGVYQFQPFYSMMSKKYKDQIQQLSKVLEIEKSLHKPVKSFSGGMKRKLEIVRSLLHTPEILFLDEPTTGLDPSARNSLWEYLNHVQDESGTTIFLTTHYLEEAEGADKVIMLSEGKIAASGTPLELKDQLVEEEVILETKNIEALKTELKSKNIKFEDSTDINKYQVKINLNEYPTYELIKQIDTKIDKVHTTRPSLEQAYLKVVKKSK